MPKMHFRGSQHSSDPLAGFKERLTGRGKEWKGKKGERKGKWKGKREIRDMKKEKEETGRNETGENVQRPSLLSPPSQALCIHL